MKSILKIYIYSFLKRNLIKIMYNLQYSSIVKKVIYFHEDVNNLTLQIFNFPYL